MTLLLEGSGAELVPAIRDAARALVFISVPWSGAERNARQLFRAAISQFEGDFTERGIRCFLLDVDEDEVSKQWLSSIGFIQFSTFGSGSLLWLESGRVISSEITANSLSINGIVARSTSLWKAAAEVEAPTHQAADESQIGCH